MEAPHVLVVDDEDDIRAIAEMSLARIGGFRVTCVADATEALVTMRAGVPDLLLLDNMMPGMSGPELAEVIRADERLADVPIVFMTARVSADDQQRYVDAGGCAFIAKPFDPMTLPDEVRAVLEGGPKGSS